MLKDGAADLVSMARPFLADPDFVKKAANSKPEEINTCIACNQVIRCGHVNNIDVILNI